MFTFYCWLSIRGNLFLVCSACDEIGSAYAQHAIKSFPRMVSIRNNACYNFRKILKKYQIKMQILTLNNQNFQKPSRNPSNRTKVKILKEKNFWIAHQKNLVPRMLSHHGNVRTSKFWRKSKEKKQKNSKLSHACVPLNRYPVPVPVPTARVYIRCSDFEM